MSSTESRLAAVERQLRFHRAVIATLLVALVALVGYGATERVPEEILQPRIWFQNKQRTDTYDAWVANLKQERRAFLEKYQVDEKIVAAVMN